jgi:S1-C subfamily serine protease
MSARPAPQNTSGGQDNSKQRRVRTGFIPDMGGEPGKGMLIQGVGKGSPAEKAGVKAGDRLVQFGDVKIVDIEDLQSALVKAEPGKPTKIIVIRDGKQVELTIVPELAGG